MTEASPHDGSREVFAETLQSSPGIGFKASRAAVILPLVLLLSACGEPGCDSAEVLQTAKELVIQRIHNSGFNDSFDLTINNIRTQDTSSTELACEADAVLTNSTMLTAVGATTFTYDVNYRVEQTTDGKLYITVYPLHMNHN
jgi:hypothetical protein